MELRPGDTIIPKDNLTFTSANSSRSWGNISLFKGVRYVIISVLGDKVRLGINEGHSVQIYRRKLVKQIRYNQIVLINKKCNRINGSAPHYNPMWGLQAGMTLVPKQDLAFISQENKNKINWVELKKDKEYEVYQHHRGRILEVSVIDSVTKEWLTINEYSLYQAQKYIAVIQNLEYREECEKLWQDDSRRVGEYREIDDATDESPLEG